ncbi:hypothetical protein V6617_14180 [Pelagibacterium nitratireducens]|uniref:Uncharacterized protein n=1 Tax=Pelagibacterium nitratireducens TaxID=1046114 RepID=A0ABZ2HWY4_9HYPH
MPGKSEREVPNEKGSTGALPFPRTACKPAFAGADKAVPGKSEREVPNEKGSAEALPFPFETLERSQFFFFKA